MHLFREPRRHARGGSAGVNAATRVALLPWRELMKASLYWGEALGHSIAERRASVANVLLTCCIAQRRARPWTQHRRASPCAVSLFVRLFACLQTIQ